MLLCKTGNRWTIRHSISGRQQVFSLLQKFQNISGTYTSSYLIVTGDSIPEGKVAGKWMWSFASLRAEIKNECSYTYTSTLHLHGPNKGNSAFIYTVYQISSFPLCDVPCTFEIPVTRFLSSNKAQFAAQFMKIWASKMESLLQRYCLKITARPNSLRHDRWVKFLVDVTRVHQNRWRLSPYSLEARKDTCVSEYFDML
jgi:hypothetical protein